jgi:hypothetical protein
MKFSDRFMTQPRMLIAAFVISLSLVAPLAVQTLTADASTATAAKKCKKGYKKVGKKCKKKKKKSAAPKPETVVSGAVLASVHQIARTKVQIKGNVTFSKTPAPGTLTAVVNITTASSGNIAAQATIQVDGKGKSQPFNAISVIPPLENGKDARLTLLGIDYNTVPVT